MSSTILGIIASSGAAASTSSYESIVSATGTGSSNTITFSSIPATYKHLQIRCLARDTNVNNDFSDIRIRLNSDTATNYTRHLLKGDGTTVTGTGSITQTSMIVNGAARQDASTANIFGVSIIDFIDYASSTKNKTMRAFAGNDVNGSGGVNLSSALWLNTNAITTIDLFTNAGNWTTTSTFALYGIKG
jgi:hypothetical protein